ncbi:MAG: hypothetical protein K2N58_09870 [Treponemataceae bacterium]|nr:hypothetical protein [Treponemataceae bacterium]
MMFCSKFNTGNFKKAFVLASAIFGASLLHATPSFSGVAAGSIGVDGKIRLDNGDSDWSLPIALFGAFQADFTEWFTTHAEIEIRAKDFPLQDIFSGNEAVFKVHELSAIFSRRAITSTHYFSIYFGSYEALGTDTFLMRQFGIDQISSPLAKSVTNISGVPLYSSTGGGISYIARLDKAPVANGCYIYLNNQNGGKLALNLDYRLAVATDIFTMDFIAGLSSMVRDKGEHDDEYIIAIKTLTLHTGINMFLGNKYTHGLLLQAGLNNLVLNGKNSLKIDESDISFFVEPRIRAKRLGVNVSAYALSQESVDDLLYLTDRVGAAATLYFDDIETKRFPILLGVHLIGSIADMGITDLFGGENLDGIKFNVFLTPYIEISFSKSSNFETMLQVGMLDVINSSRALNFKIVAGYRKVF